ncbi:MAG: hypothetical protein J6D54_02255 [Olsenella sp.]|nr:hypothetical protein [Olsenella sp.]
MQDNEDERMINSVLAYQDKQLREFRRPDMSAVEERISTSESLLASLGYALPTRPAATATQRRTSIVVRQPSWDELCAEAIAEVGSDVDLRTLFTEEELRENALAVRRLNYEFDQLHRLDKVDVAIAALAGLLAGAVDVFMVGLPRRTPDGLKAGPLSDYIRKALEERYPEERIKELEKVAKVPYDAQDNRHTMEHVEGLSTWYHRLYSLGHDPFLGFIVGTCDILTGRMTTIDKTGKIVSQVMENYADRRESDVFAALAKQFLHLQSDVMTPRGIPVPFMGLFNLLQFGNIGEDGVTVAEIVQGMYYQQYDFAHFCSMSVSAMLVEVVVRVAYAIKRVKEGVGLRDAIPLTTNRERMPKLGTMLFMAHSAATAINAGKMFFGKDPVMAAGSAGAKLVMDPMALNYPQWIAFGKYSYQQLKWSLITKPAMRDRYVLDAIDSELEEVYDDINELFEDVQRGGILMLPATM